MCKTFTSFGSEFAQETIYQIPSQSPHFYRRYYKKHRTQCIGQCFSPFSVVLGYTLTKPHPNLGYITTTTNTVIVIKNNTRGIQKVRRLTQLAMRYARHILSLFNIVSCNWNALGPTFLQSSDSVLEEMLFLVFQPAICRADNVLVVRNFVVSFHEFLQFRKKIEVTWSQDNPSDHWSAEALAVIKNAGFELLRHPPYSPFVFVLHGKWPAGRPRTTILLQRNQNFGETLDQVYFSCMRLCWKVTKYNVRIA